MITRHALLLIFLLTPLAGADDLSALDALPAPFSDAKAGEKATYAYRELMEVKNPTIPVAVAEPIERELSLEFVEDMGGRLTLQQRPSPGPHPWVVDRSISFRDYIVKGWGLSDGIYDSVKVGRVRRDIGGRSYRVYLIRVRSKNAASSIRPAGSGEVIIEYAPEAPVNGILRWVKRWISHRDTGTIVDTFEWKMTGGKR